MDRALPAPVSLAGQPAWLGLLAAVLFAACVPFAPGLAALAGNWQQPEYSHGWLIPLVTLYLLWQRRGVLAAARGPGSWAGIGLVGLGLLGLVLSRMALMQTPEAVGFLLVVAGLGLATIGPAAMRFAWLPLAFLLFTLPVPATAYYILSTKLQLVSSEIGAFLLRLSGVSVYLEGNIIDLGTYRLQVAEACSGLRYLFPLSAFGFLCAWLYRAPFWARLAVLAAIVPITVLTNSLRIALTGLFIEHGSIALAEGFMHLFEGWAIFLVAIVALFALMMLLNRLAGRPAGLAALLDFERIAEAGPAGRPPPEGLRPLLPLLAACLLLLAAVPLQAWAGSRAEQAPPRPGLATFPLLVGPWHGREQPVDEAVRATLLTDDHLLADFTAPGQPAGVNFWVAYYASQIRGGRIHSPRECLPGTGWEFVRIEPVAAPAPAPDGTPFTVNRALAAKGSSQVLMYYWYEQRGRRLTDEVWTKLSILADALTLHRSDGALVRLLTPVLPGESVAAAEARLAGFLRAAYPLLQPHVGL